MPDHLMISPPVRREMAALPEGLRKLVFDVILLLLEQPHPPGSQAHEGVADMYWLELDQVTIYYNAFGTGTIILQQVVVND
ncbi:hypothetical protein SAMN04489713_10543 [Actinomadura madurae]|uniref:Type II toxin-antitoxin system RelE/ParE family toxin n=1 Tax=Actinomadura madurae TaxID=1993 RepID=A0A1I5G6W5_9ACTN|nr:hypothetical protein [Actinomadura madurae]SFO31231.1 hypothetical protein SAMN04489713_10543 [Actinomadura madurae]